jgi:hypothetical protein
MSYQQARAFKLLCQFFEMMPWNDSSVNWSVCKKLGLTLPELFREAGVMQLALIKTPAGKDLLVRTLDRLEKHGRTVTKTSIQSPDTSANTKEPDDLPKAGRSKSTAKQPEEPYNMSEERRYYFKEYRKALKASFAKRAAAKAKAQATESDSLLSGPIPAPEVIYLPSATDQRPQVPTKTLPSNP